MSVRRPSARFRAPRKAAASISTGLPASTSCSIEVLNAPSLRVTALRSSPLCSIGQPILAPIAAASRITARQKPFDQRIVENAVDGCTGERGDRVHGHVAP